MVADVFTDKPLEGNQLAVFTDAREIPEDMLQPLAREMNFSETVFVLPPEQGGHARIRIFTPATELRFAGHPTLGSAFVLAAPLQLGEIRLETLAGVIPVRLEREGARITFGWMEQLVPDIKTFPDEAALLAAGVVDREDMRMLQSGGHLWMVGAQALFLDSQCSFVERLCLSVVTLYPVKLRQVV